MNADQAGALILGSISILWLGVAYVLGLWLTDGEDE